MFALAERTHAAAGGASGGEKGTVVRVGPIVRIWMFVGSALLAVVQCRMGQSP